jgi:hypothetical protein
MEKKVPVDFQHIKKLKDVKTLSIIENPNKTSDFCFICPLSKIEYNGFNKFYVNWVCGCVFSDKAYSLIKSQDKKCLVCGAEDRDLVCLNMSPDEQHDARVKILNKQHEKKGKVSCLARKQKKK